eukprot:12399520-Karenia_brevis.AAC.1
MVGDKKEKATNQIHPQAPRQKNQIHHPRQTTRAHPKIPTPPWQDVRKMNSSPRQGTRGGGDNYDIR